MGRGGRRETVRSADDARERKLDRAIDRYLRHHAIELMKRLRPELEF